MVSLITNRTFYLILSILLAIIVFTSKEILLFNEETLVAITFLIFMAFAYINLSDVFISELQERASKIQKEFDYYHSLKLEILNLLISYHKKQISLLEEITNVFNFSKKEIKNIIIKRQKALENNITLQIQQKLRTILLKELNIIQEIQVETSYWFSKFILDKFKSNLKTKLAKSIIIKEGINTIDRMSQFGFVDNKLLNLSLILNKVSNVPVNLLLIPLISNTKFNKSNKKKRNK